MSKFPFSELISSKVRTVDVQGKTYLSRRISASALESRTTKRPPPTSTRKTPSTGKSLRTAVFKT